MSLYLIALCFIQGVSEFLPISSSAHLILFSHFFKGVPTSLELEVALHLGTLFAIIGYYWQELWKMAQVVWLQCFRVKLINTQDDHYLQQAINLIIATLPAITVGYTIKKLDIVQNSLSVIGYSSIVFGIVLYIADRFQKQTSNFLSKSKAFIIGCAQILAFIPGASRLGNCMMGGRLMGLNRLESIKFAFLLSIPTVLGAVILTGYDIRKQNIEIDYKALILAIMFTAFIGSMVIRTVIWFIQHYTFKVFCLYRILLGVIILLLIKS